MAGRRQRLLAVLACLVALSAAGCHSHPTAARSVKPSPADAVVVASFNFRESDVLAQVYAQALQAVGVPVRLELDLGPRELVLPALHQGQVDVVPEYLGSALNALVPGAQAAGPAAALAGLRRALRPWGVRALTPAAAQNQNGLVVTRDTARRLSLHTVADLRRVSSRLTLGAPFECPKRAYCLPGLDRVYGLTFARFMPLDSEDQRVSALEEGVVNVAVLFTSEGRLAADDLVLLDDNRHLQPPENIVPVVSERAVARFGPRVTEQLDAVSAKLTTQSLVFLNWRVGVAHRGAAAEAGAWLRRHGLASREW